MSSAASTTTTLQTMASISPLDDVPSLSIKVLDGGKDKVHALKLVADSVAQQRQTASKILVFHPLCVSVLVLILSIAHWATDPGRDWASLTLTYSGFVLSYLITIRYFTGAYIHLAEDTDWAQWIKKPDGSSDVIIGALFGDKLIGALVMRLELSEGKGIKKGARRVGVTGEGNKASIRAWTTLNRYRRRGLGGDLLREAVRVAKVQLGENVTIEIAEDHANSTLVLHNMFNKLFHTRDRKAKEALSRVIAEEESKNRQ